MSGQSGTLYSLAVEGTLSTYTNTTKTHSIQILYMSCLQEMNTEDRLFKTTYCILTEFHTRNSH